ncbi:hypothetical protein [Candidatus Mycolicibacterium alkanivorans]|uniref:Uncharacterized protein n=1 Tax=Candidatus Mycolicibacterium alkanivorans TaxID=2954114 RepID=A0ABS9YRW1_9MYCO|nr:hypothetical protein [Candidatus Mycolicibacterium alkanivorans]MCI4673978.1 hypothetical protein [Candidatus Mycolicibacterium alkanivorans]
MRSKLAVIVSLLFVLAIGGAALAVNTRILNTSPQPDIGRANEVLIPGGGQPASQPTPPPAVPTPPPAVPTLSPAAPPPTVSREDDEHSSGEHQTEGEDRHERDD